MHKNRTLNTERISINRIKRRLQIREQELQGSRITTALASMIASLGMLKQVSCYEGWEGRSTL
jgi:hypothetical protein